MTGKVYLVGAGPGDPGLITVKGLRCLEEADVIVYDRLVSPLLLRKAKAGSEQVYAGKGPKAKAMEQEAINQLLVDKAKQGKIVVRLKGGDPFVFGRGGEEAEALHAAGVPFEVVPGVTSAIAVPAYAGIPVTHRGMAVLFTVLTGHEDQTKAESQAPWDALASGQGTLVILMGVGELPQITRRLLHAKLPPETPAAVISHGAGPRQRTVVGTLGDIGLRAQEAGLEPPAVTVIGEVVRLRDRLHWHESRPLFGKRVLVTRARKQASALVERLADLGAEGIELPTIAIEPLKDAHALDDAIGRAGKFDWVLFTSVNGVEAFFERAKATGASIPEDVRFGALGPATAQALRDRQARVDFLPTLFSSRGIAEAFAPHAASRPRVLLPRADIAPELLVRALEGLGAQVEQVVAYRTVAPAEAKATARKVIAEGIDVATFTSSSTVRNLYELLDGDLSAIERATIVCIGPVTAETARALGLRVDVVAAEHTVEGLVKALVAHFEKGGA